MIVWSALVWFWFSVLFLFCVVLSVASPPGGQDDSDTITAVDEVYTKDAVDESRNETADRVASYQADQKVEPVYATRAARRLLRLLRMFFGFIFFLSGFPIIIMKYALLVEPVLGGAFCFCFLFILLPVASPEGHDLVAYPSCLRLGLFFPSPPWSSLAIVKQYLFRGQYLLRGICVPYFFIFFALPSFGFRFFSSLSMYLGCWRAYVVPVVSSTMA